MNKILKFNKYGINEPHLFAIVYCRLQTNCSTPLWLLWVCSHLLCGAHACVCAFAPRRSPFHHIYWLKARKPLERLAGFIADQFANSVGIAGRMEFIQNEELNLKSWKTVILLVEYCNQNIDEVLSPNVQTLLHIATTNVIFTYNTLISCDTSGRAVSVSY